MSPSSAPVLNPEHNILPTWGILYLVIRRRGGVRVSERADSQRAIRNRVLEARCPVARKPVKRAY